MKRIDWLSQLMTAAVFLAWSIFSLISTAALGRAQSVDIVHNFAAGMSPSAGLIQGIGSRSPFLYGMTQSSGVNNGGTVFKISPDGTFSVIHSFQCPADGCIGGAVSNSTGLIQLSDGSLYGTTQLGGTDNGGTVFKISSPPDGTFPDGTFSVIHSFQCAADGCDPFAGLIRGTEGDDEFLYGTTTLGGPSNGGSVFKIKPDGTGFSVIHFFQCVSEVSCSFSPFAGLIQGTGGFLYGTTVGSAGNVSGTVFKIKPDGTGFSVIHSFQGGAADGALPFAGLIQGTGGVLYGTTQDGGTANGGTVFKISPPQGQTVPDGTGFSVIHSFQGGATDGRSPLAGLIRGTEGTDEFLYGTTRFGGTNDSGTVFKVSPDGNVFNIIDSFVCGGNDGCLAEASLIKASDGNLYGTTPQGGSFGSGTIFRVLVPVTDNAPPIANAGSDQTVDATSPAGATVTLDGTGSSDPDGDPVAFSWKGPFGTATGSKPTVTVPIGTHIITLTVTDPSGASGEDTVTVTVRSPAQMAANLITTVKNLKFQQGINLLQNALKGINAGNTKAACNQINAFTNQVQAQSGKQLTVPQANQLITSANQIKTALGCS